MAGLGSSDVNETGVQTITGNIGHSYKEKANNGGVVNGDFEVLPKENEKNGRGIIVKKDKHEEDFVKVKTESASKQFTREIITDVLYKSTQMKDVRFPNLSTGPPGSPMNNKSSQNSVAPLCTSIQLSINRNNLGETFVVTNLTKFVYNTAAEGTILSYHKHSLQKRSSEYLMSVRVRCRRFKRRIGKCSLAYNAKLRCDGRGWDVTPGGSAQHTHPLDVFENADVRKKQSTKYANLIFTKIKDTAACMMKRPVNLRFGQVLINVQMEFEKAFLSSTPDSDPNVKKRLRTVQMELEKARFSSPADADLPIKKQLLKRQYSNSEGDRQKNVRFRTENYKEQTLMSNRYILPRNVASPYEWRWRVMFFLAPKMNPMHNH